MVVNPTTSFDWVVVGCGFTGLRLATFLASKNQKVLICRRSQKALDDMGDLGPWIEKCASNKSELKDARMGGAVLVDSAPPSPNEAESELVRCANEQNVKKIIYLSSTGVYDNGKGSWVDENYPLKPLGIRGHKRLKAEETIRVQAQTCGVRWNVLRLPAIYGPGRGVHQRLLRKSYMPVETQTFVSRIHVDDLVRAIWQIGNSQSFENEVFNVADDTPERSSVVCKDICNTLGILFPGFRSLESVDEDKKPMFMANRKISNQKLVNGLGFSLLYPSWKEGVAQCLIEEQQKT